MMKSLHNYKIEDNKKLQRSIQRIEQNHNEMKSEIMVTISENERLQRRAGDLEAELLERDYRLGEIQAEKARLEYDNREMKHALLTMKAKLSLLNNITVPESRIKSRSYPYCSSSRLKIEGPGYCMTNECRDYFNTQDLFVPTNSAALKHDRTKGMNTRGAPLSSRYPRHDASANSGVTATRAATPLRSAFSPSSRLDYPGREQSRERVLITFARSNQ